MKTTVFNNMKMEHPNNKDTEYVIVPDENKEPQTFYNPKSFKNEVVVFDISEINQ